MTTLRIPEADFWTNPRRTQLEVANQLLDDGFRGLLVDAPRLVDVTRRTELPLVVARAATHAERRGPPFEGMAVLVAVRLPSNQVFVGSAFEPKEARPGPPPPSGPAPQGASVVLYDLDVRARLPGLPWRAGELLTRVLYRDVISGCARTALTSGPAAPADPAVERFLADQPAAFPQPVWPSADGARWEAAPGDPELPAAPGIALAVERAVVVPARGEARCELRAAALVPWRPRYAVRPDPGPGPAKAAPRRETDELDEPTERALRAAAARAAEARALGLVWQDPGDPRATAVVPLTVVAVHAEGGATAFPLQVPVRAPLDPDAPPATVELRVAVDLLELPFGGRLVGRTSFIYAFTDGLMAGPVPTAVMREQDLRP